uniref:SET domain-containing protein n=1 Tax=Knipowitschia caucasica TaxID=637954 RepID=A0AAV2J0M4_KNICA
MFPTAPTNRGLSAKKPPDETETTTTGKEIVNTWFKGLMAIRSVGSGVFRRGLFAVGSICKGDFVVEYRGDLIDDAEAERRRKVYHPSCAAFFFLFKWIGKTWCIDASREDGSFGRLVNDEHRHPNCRMKKVEVEGSPHLCLFALKDIKDGEEITYDYGGNDCPWRIKNITHPAKSSHPAVMSEKRMEEAPSPQDTPQQMTLCAIDTHPAKSSHPAVMSEKRMEEAPSPQDTPQQMTLCAIDTHPAKSSHPAVMSEKRMEEAPSPQDTPQQMTLCAIDTHPAKSSHPAVMSEKRMEEAPSPQDTPQQMTLCAIDTHPAKSSHPAVMSEKRMEEAPSPQDTPQQNHQMRKLLQVLWGMKTQQASNTDAQQQSMAHLLESILWHIPLKNHQQRKLLQVLWGMKTQQASNTDAQQQSMEHLLESVLWHIPPKVKLHRKKHPGRQQRLGR